MKLSNIVGKVKFCRSAFSKAAGLMFSKKEDKALVFEFEQEKKIGLHMFFVFYPIDVLFLDEGKKVVEIKENFRPFTGYVPKNRSKYVIELPAGKVKELNIKINDEIGF